MSVTIADLISDLHNPAIKRRRAAAQHLGRTADPSVIPHLVEALSDTHPMVRSDIVQALGRLGDSSACLLYTSPSPRDGLLSRMPSSA